MNFYQQRRTTKDQGTYTYSRISVADCNYQSILPNIAQQHHLCPNDVVISIGPSNRQFPKLLNDPIVNCIVV